MSSRADDRDLQKFIVRANIERFRKLLETAADDTERAKLRQLLGAEERKLSELESAPDDE